MTALDQAFIKAYRTESRAPVARPQDADPSSELQLAPEHSAERMLDLSPPEASPPAPHVDLTAALSSQVAVVGSFDPLEPSTVDPPPVPEEPTPPATEAETPQPAPNAERPGPEVPIPSPSDSPQRLPPLVRPLQEPVAEGADTQGAIEPPSTFEAGESPDGATADLAPPCLPETSPPPPDAPAPVVETGWTLGKGFHRIDPPEALQPAAMPVESASPAEASEQEAPSETEPPAIETGKQESCQPFRPLLRVDRFAWPSVCQRLAHSAASALDGLADQLVAARDRGIRVVAMAGCRPGDGASTALLCAARQLVGRGLHVAVVDANLVDPQLARRLGLLPELGLDDLLGGRQPLEELAIESTAEAMVLVPLSHPVAEKLDGTSAPRFSAAIDALVGTYDLVLVDLGSLHEPAAAEGSLVRALRVVPTAVVLVASERPTAPLLAGEARRMLDRAGVELLGLVENFRRAAPA